MQRDVLLEMLEQNRFTSHFALDRVTEDTRDLRLNEKAASAGFIYRHIGETMNLFAQFLGKPTDVVNTTIGASDTGQGHDVARSKLLIQQGYETLKALVNESSGDEWLKPVDTPFFGTVSRARLFAHTLYHTSHHAGQIAMTLSKGS